MISHTRSDLLALPAEEDRMKARRFVERSGMVICGGLTASEMPLLTAADPALAAGTAEAPPRIVPGCGQLALSSPQAPAIVQQAVAQLSKQLSVAGCQV